VEMMFGRIFAESQTTGASLGDVRLRLEGLTLHERSIETTDLTLSVHDREVVGLAGLEGSGQRTLLRACVGLVRPLSGTVQLDGEDMTGRNYREFLATGVHYLPAGRLEEGLVQGLTIAEHFVLVGHGARFFIDLGQARRVAGERIAANRIKGTPTSTADSLSGGNQQRLLLAMLPPKLRLLLMEHPTRGLDIESADWVWTQLLARRDGGTAIVFSSADLDELLRYSDRILVFFAGQVIKVLDARETSGEEIGHLIGGKELV
jgi:ABC-type uncharacterized transport system ATPase subunit